MPVAGAAGHSSPWVDRAHDRVPAAWHSEEPLTLLELIEEDLSLVWQFWSCRGRLLLLLLRGDGFASRLSRG
jgi:hypothetical protein